MADGQKEQEVARVVKGYQVWYPDELKYRISKDLAAIMDSGNFVLGDFTKRFETGMASFCGKKFGVAVQSDSAALEIALRCMGVEGKYVVMPEMSFFGCVEAVYRAGAKPILVDISISNGVFPTAEKILEVVNDLGVPNVGAVLAVYTAGYLPGDLEELATGLKVLGVPLVEDVAHCYGTTRNGKHAGSVGDLSCWSFFATKVVTTLGEGGLILSDNPALVDLMRKYRNYGRGQTWGTGLAEVRGYNWRMTEIQAAVGVEIMGLSKELQAKRIAVAREYDRLFDSGLCLYVSAVPPPPGVKLGFYRYIVLLPRKMNKLKVKEKLLALGVGIQGDVYEVGATRQTIYPELRRQGPFSESEEWADRHLCLPIHLAMQPGDEEYVVRTLDKVVRELL